MGLRIFSSIQPLFITQIASYFVISRIISVHNADYCQNIFVLLLSMFLISGILVGIFYSSIVKIFSGISNFIFDKGLGIFAIFYCNPQIDMSFTSFIHFIQICICISGLLYLGQTHKSNIWSDKFLNYCVNFSKWLKRFLHIL